MDLVMYFEGKGTIGFFFASPAELMDWFLDGANLALMRTVEVVVTQRVTGGFRSRSFIVASSWDPAENAPYPRVRIDPTQLEDPDYLDRLAGEVWEAAERILRWRRSDLGNVYADLTAETRRLAT